MSNADSCYVKLVDYDSDSGEDVTSQSAVTTATVGVGEKNVATSVSSSERIRRVNIVGKTTSSKSRETSGEAAATAIKAKILSHACPVDDRLINGGGRSYNLLNSSVTDDMPPLIPIESTPATDSSHADALSSSETRLTSALRSSNAPHHASSKCSSIPPPPVLPSLCSATSRPVGVAKPIMRTEDVGNSVSTGNERGTRALTAEEEWGRANETRGASARRGAAEVNDDDDDPDQSLELGGGYSYFLDASYEDNFRREASFDSSAAAASVPSPLNTRQHHDRSPFIYNRPREGIEQSKPAFSQSTVRKLAVISFRKTSSSNSTSIQPKIVPCMRENRREKNSALIFLSVCNCLHSFRWWK